MPTCCLVPLSKIFNRKEGNGDISKMDVLQPSVTSVTPSDHASKQRATAKKDLEQSVEDNHPLVPKNDKGMFTRTPIERNNRFVVDRLRWYINFGTSGIESNRQYVHRPTCV